jgi:hypothetical protein
MNAKEKATSLYSFARSAKKRITTPQKKATALHIAPTITTTLTVITYWRKNNGYNYEAS